MKQRKIDIPRIKASHGHSEYQSVKRCGGVPNMKSSFADCNLYPCFRSIQPINAFFSFFKNFGPLRPFASFSSNNVIRPLS